MLIEADPKQFYHYFAKDPHPFISQGFTVLNSKKAERVLYVTEDSSKPALGLVAGVRNGWLLSPFSAPFGGFHFRKEVMYISEIQKFLESLKHYIISNNYQGVKITLPPDIYAQTFNSKLVKAFYREGYQNDVIDITNWVDLQAFQDRFTQKNSREYYKQALRNGLEFIKTNKAEEYYEIYELIRQNREKFGRPIYMTLKDIKDTGELWPVDFFKVTTADNAIKAAAIIYRSHPDITYALFWGDNDAGRQLRAMDFLAFHLWSYYKKKGFKYMDLGISTEAGEPNEGLLRFKESHQAVSSLKYRFAWQPEQ
jgi:hypothetical protein